MTDVNVQFFSHRNALSLGNNTGDLIRLLDTCLVNGKVLPTILLQSMNQDTGDITLEFSANHNCLQFQIIELSGFSPANINGKYRIKGVTNNTTIILKSDLINTTITSVGIVKLAPLGYEIIFRDEADVKRVYRAKDPSTNHPFIRVDESLTTPDGTTGVYNSTYAKFAMVGLLENMTHIDDYTNPDVLQLPMQTTALDRNYKISGTGTSVVRGWSRWYYTRSYDAWSSANDTGIPANGDRYFTLVGDPDAFYLLSGLRETSSDYRRFLKACGLYNANHDTNQTPNWFLMSMFTPTTSTAATNYEPDNIACGSPLTYNVDPAKFFVPRIFTQRLVDSTHGLPILFDYMTGTGKINGTNPAAIEIPFYDLDAKLRGTLKHVMYSGNTRGNILTTPVLGDTSMYVTDSANTGSGGIGSLYFYLGEL